MVDCPLRTARFRRALLAAHCLLFFTSCSHQPSALSRTVWDYVALGDSITFGGARPSFVADLATYIERDTGARVRVINLGVPGWTSRDLLRALERDERFRTSVERAEVITVDIGANDLAMAREQHVTRACGGGDGQQCLDRAVNEFRANWTAILGEILRISPLRRTVIRVANVYQFLVGEDRADGRFALYRRYFDQVDDWIANIAARDGIPIADVHLAFNGPRGDQDPSEQGLLDPDGLHPNDRGAQAIADLFRRLGYSPLH